LILLIVVRPTSSLLERRIARDEREVHQELSVALQ